MQTIFLLMRQCETSITDPLDMVRNNIFPALSLGMLKTGVFK